MKIFSGASNRLLTEKICNCLSLPIGKIELKTFPSNEKYCRYEENIRGEDVFLIQSGSNPVNDNLMELLVMSDAARRASAKRITAVIPLFFYQRQERKDKPRVPISVKLVMDLLEAAGVTRILTMDLHAAQIAGMTNLPLDQLTFKPALYSVIKDMGFGAVVSPDIGGIKKADEYATLLKTDLVIISKKRNNATSVEVKHFIGDVKGKKVIIVDDMTESAGTLIEASECCKLNGALEICCAISHGCFTSTGYGRLINSFKNNLINKLFVSNSVNFEDEDNWKMDGDMMMRIPKQNYSNRVITVDVSQWFATAIDNIHNNKSVSELFY